MGSHTPQDMLQLGRVQFKLVVLSSLRDCANFVLSPLFTVSGDLSLATTSPPPSRLLQRRKVLARIKEKHVLKKKKRYLL